MTQTVPPPAHEYDALEFFERIEQTLESVSLLERHTALSAAIYFTLKGKKVTLDSPLGILLSNLESTTNYALRRNATEAGGPR